MVGLRAKDPDAEEFSACPYGGELRHDNIGVYNGTDSRYKHHQKMFALTQKHISQNSEVSPTAFNNASADVAARW